MQNAARAHREQWRWVACSVGRAAGLSRESSPSHPPASAAQQAVPFELRNSGGAGLFVTGLSVALLPNLNANNSNAIGLFVLLPPTPGPGLDASSLPSAATAPRWQGDGALRLNASGASAAVFDLGSQLFLPAGSFVRAHSQSAFPIHTSLRVRRPRLLAGCGGRL